MFLNISKKKELWISINSLFIIKYFEHPEINLNLQRKKQRIVRLQEQLLGTIKR